MSGLHHYCGVNSLCQKKKTYVLELTFWMRTLPFNMALLYYKVDLLRVFREIKLRKHPRRPRADGQLGRGKRRQKISRTGERAPGMLLLNNQFHDSFECLSVIGNKFSNRRPASIALLSWSLYTKEITTKLDCSLYGLARAGEFSSSFQWKLAPKNQRNSIIGKFPYNLVHFSCMQQFHTILHT